MQGIRPIKSQKYAIVVGIKTGYFCCMQIFIKHISVLLLALAGSLSLCNLQDDFKITIYREYPAAGCTSGYLAVNDSIICYSLERPWKDNQQNISSIPTGVYSAILRYDHNDHWRIELLNVPNRTNIQIHIGNTIDDISGCILVGDRLGNDLCSIVAGTSTTAYAKLKNAFYGTDNPTSTPDKNISVEIKGPTQ
jgi:hypothetical protein